MTEFHEQIRKRAAKAVASLDKARAQDDDYLVEVQEAELENLARLAREHGLAIPELAAYSAA
jgi:hypothetical protein